MQYEIEIDGRRSRVAVTRTGTGFSVAVDDRTIDVQAARVDAYTLSLLLSGTSHEVIVTPAAGSGQLVVRVGSTPVAVTLNGRRRWSGGEGHARASAGPLRVVAPMPGKVVRVLVKPGDAVRARQPLIVVEAMKMENEIRAERDGTIAQVHVQEGSSVDAGAPLVVIE